MLHPSYSDLMAVVNSEVEQGEQPVVQSRYSIVLATAKRARQIIEGQEPLVKSKAKGLKPLSIAVTELHNGKIKIMTEEDYAAEQALEDEKAKYAMEIAEKLKAEAELAKEAENEVEDEVEEDYDEEDEETFDDFDEEDSEE